MYKYLLLLSLVACGPQPQLPQKGDQGIRGLTGSVGPQGPVGSPGSSVTVVKFCPNSQPLYPSVFPEIGICIANKLYAVYSLNNGFLVEVIPGSYSSNALGSSCNFKVLSNCVIQN
jgi:hypothetical protein